MYSVNVSVVVGVYTESVQNSAVLLSLNAHCVLLLHVCHCGCRLKRVADAATDVQYDDAVSDLWTSSD